MMEPGTVRGRVFFIVTIHWGSAWPSCDYLFISKVREIAKSIRFLKSLLCRVWLNFYTKAKDFAKKNFKTFFWQSPWLFFLAFFSLDSLPWRCKEAEFTPTSIVKVVPNHLVRNIFRFRSDFSILNRFPLLFSRSSVPFLQDFFYSRLYCGKQWRNFASE